MNKHAAPRLPLGAATAPTRPAQCELPARSRISWVILEFSDFVAAGRSVRRTGHAGVTGLAVHTSDLAEVRARSDAHKRQRAGGEWQGAKGRECHVVATPRVSYVPTEGNLQLLPGSAV